MPGKAPFELRASQPGDSDVKVAIRRSPRARRMTLRIGASGAVVLTLPQRTGTLEAQRFLEDQREWLDRRLARLPPAVPFRDGAIVPFRGVPHILRHAPQERAPVALGDGVIAVSGAPQYMERRVADWLRRNARSALGARVALHASALGRRPKRIAIRDTVSRWGSCSSTGALSFSWRLVLAPDSVLDYVAAHEVAHLAEPNHGPRFWSLVEQLDPDYRVARAWLRREGAGLHRYGSSRRPG